MLKRGNFESESYDFKRRRRWSQTSQGNSRSRSRQRCHEAPTETTEINIKRYEGRHQNRCGYQQQQKRFFSSQLNVKSHQESSRQQGYGYGFPKKRNFFQSERNKHNLPCDRYRGHSNYATKYDLHSNERNKSTSVSVNTSLSSSTMIRDDKDGHLVFRMGDWIEDRFQIVTLLGEGTFCKCVECYDKKRDSSIALKIVKNIDHYRESAKIEIRVLKKIARRDPNQKKLCIPLLSYFNYHGHICLVFPKLGKNVFQFMRENKYQPYTMAQVQHISYQLLTAVKFLHSINLTHTDLKPENMLFVDSSFYKVWSESARRDIYLLRNSEIRLIDFGSATFDDEYHSTVVSTRHYRAPEVILELGWSQPCDMWSCGCIIFELFTGNALFKTHDNKEHLAMMEHVLGPFPSDMIYTSKKKYFDSGKVSWDSSKSIKENCKTLKEYINLNHDNYNQLYDILKQLLTYDPKSRLTAADALTHPFFDSFRSKNQNSKHGKPS